MDIDLIAAEFCEHGRHVRGYTESTLRGLRGYLRHFARHSGMRTLAQVTSEGVAHYFLRGRRDRNWKPHTFIRHYRCLTVFFRWCSKRGLIRIDPLEGLELPRAEKRLPARLNRQSALRILEVAYNYPYQYHFLRYRNHAIFAMFIFAGVRKSELLGMRLTDADVENLTVFVNQGKGRKDRMVPMSYALAASLRRYLGERSRLGKTCPELFTSLNRNTGFTESGLKRLVDKMAACSGVDFTVHRLRHTFATLMLEGGCDIYSLSRMMGHSDIKTTGIYLSASVEHLRSQLMKHPLSEPAQLICP